MRNEPLPIALLVLILGLGGCGGGVQPPDVVLVTLDTTRADHLGPYGYDRKTTPRIDIFARTAVVFERAWSTASWTLPAHASIFTGLYSRSHGAHYHEAGTASLAEAVGEPGANEAHALVRVNRLAPEVETLAELLREHDYATAAFAGGPWLDPAFGLMQGYDEVQAESKTFEGVTADRLTADAIAWLARVPPDQPLHLLVNYFDPHGPYVTRAHDTDLPGTHIPLVATETGVMRGEPLSGLQRIALVDRYDAEIRFMDLHVGMLIRALQRAGRFQNAIVILVADHGEMFGEHNELGHGRSLWEPVLRVPLMVRWPRGRGAGTRSQAPVSVVDLLPWIAQELGFELAGPVDGVASGARSLVLAELYPDALTIDVLGSRFDRELFVAVRWPWKLIRARPGETLLYDLGSDPGELGASADTQRALGLAAELDRAIAALEPPDRSPSSTPVRPDLRKRLRELGYVD